MDTVPPTQARPAEPPARWLGTITVEVEAAYDGNADHLAGDLYAVAVRALEERGADVYGGSCGKSEPGESTREQVARLQTLADRLERAVMDRQASPGVTEDVVTKMEDISHLTDGQITEARLDKLEEDNARLRNDLSAMRASLAAEVRTRRLVVEEEDGFERIVAEGRGTHGKIQVHARPVDQSRTAEGAILGQGRLRHDRRQR